MTYDEIYTLLCRVAAAKSGVLSGIPDTCADLHITGRSSGTIGAAIKNGTPVIFKGSTGSPDAAITISGDDFAALITGKLNPMTAMLTGRIKATGDYMKLMSIIKLIKN